jgi:hypothetical protein
LRSARWKRNWCAVPFSSKPAVDALMLRRFGFRLPSSTTTP